MRDIHAPYQYVFITPEDGDLFGKYVEMRQRAYHHSHDGLAQDFGGEDAFDHTSLILVAVQDGAVAGGARLTVSTPDAPRLLPLEEADDGTKLLKDNSLFTGLDLAHKPYGEISRMAADPAVGRKGLKLSAELSDRLCRKAAELGCDAIFFLCPEGPLNLNRRNAERLGLSFRQFGGAQLKAGREMWLCASLDLRRAYGRGGQEAA